MTETYYNFDFSNSRTVCQVCLCTINLRPMYSQEIKWFQTIVDKIFPDYKLTICVFCGHLLRKYIIFYNYCQNSQAILSQTLGQDSKADVIHQPLHNFVTTKTETNNYGEEIDLFLDNVKVQDDGFDHCEDDNDKDDDVPLVMLSKSDDGDVPLVMLSKCEDAVSENIKVKKRKKKHKKELEEPSNIEIKLEVDDEPASDTDSKKGSKKIVRDGFTSRMRQETEEYVVIKLTKEQVLEEMRTRTESEQYRRALFKCELCVVGFNFEDVLRTHMEKHTQENGTFLCDICSQYCPSVVSLRGHIKSHTTRYQCKVCGLVRRGRQHLLEHHALAHRSSHQRFNCRHCHFHTDKRTVIQRHVRSHTARERHACHECGRLFRTVESLRVHTTRHDKSRSLRCGECGRSFLYPSLLAKHKQTVHLQTEYYCVECDVRFKSPDNLRLHFKKAKRHRDSSSYSYECEQCSERFVSAASLEVHLTAAHGLPKRHACDLCRRLYSSRDSLRAHARRAHRDTGGGDSE